MPLSLTMSLEDWEHYEEKSVWSAVQVEESEHQQMQHPAEQNASCRTGNGRSDH